MPKSKSKKRKLTQNHPYNNKYSNGKTQKSSGSQNLTHEEIWDDSALLRAWDEAAAEYEFYHSIHARGEDVEEVLKQYRAANGGDDESEAMDDAGEVLDGEEDGEIAEDGEIDEGEVEGNTAAISTGQEYGSIRPENSSNIDTIVSKPPQQALPNSTQPVASNTTLPSASTQPHAQSQLPLNTQHETLENIKMAYYWAGYYSGLYDGQQQALSQTQTQSQPQTQPEPKPSPVKPEIGTTIEAKVVSTSKSEDGEV